jgi:hypothetical protein
MLWKDSTQYVKQRSIIAYLSNSITAKYSIHSVDLPTCVYWEKSETTKQVALWNSSEFVTSAYLSLYGGTDFNKILSNGYFVTLLNIGLWARKLCYMPLWHIYLRCYYLLNLF